MRRRDFYFGQKVAESELDSAFDDVELAIQQFVGDFDYIGITRGAIVTEHAPQNLTVDVSGPASIWDQNQERIAFSPTQNPNMALDENGASTAVAGAGNEKFLSLFAEFVRVDSDPRIDDDGNTVFFRRDEGFKLNVVQGAEVAAPAGAGDRPPLRGDQILLADVRLAFGQTTILNANIDDLGSRAEVAFDLTGTPNSIRQRNLGDVLQDMLDVLNAFDETTIAAAAKADAPFSLGAGTIASQLTELLALINDEAALTDFANTFLEPLTVDKNDASFPLLTTSKVPGDHPGTPTNQWKFLIGYPTGDGSRLVTLWAGDNGGTDSGHFALTVNASWDPTAEEWASQDTASPSVRLLLRISGTSTALLSLQHKAPTALAWTTWDTLPPGAGAGQPGSLFLSGNYEYAATRSRTVRLPLASGSPVVTTEADWFLDPAFGDRWRSRVNNGRINFPIRLPRNSILFQVRAQVKPGDTTGTMQIAAVRVDHGLGVGNTLNTLGTNGSDGSANRQSITVGSLSETINNANTWYAQVVASSNAGAVADELEWVEVSFTDVGLRND